MRFGSKCKRDLGAACVAENRGRGGGPGQHRVCGALHPATRMVPECSGHFCVAAVAAAIRHFFRGGGSVKKLNLGWTPFLDQQELKISCGMWEWL